MHAGPPPPPSPQPLDYPAFINARDGQVEQASSGCHYPKWFLVSGHAYQDTLFQLS